MGTNFFEFREQVTAPKRKAQSAKPPAASHVGADALTVTQLTSQIDRVVRAGFPAPVLVKGEVSNFRPNAASGHVYFTLKDAKACINCVMWKSDAARVRFAPADGMELLARGHIQVYAQQGRYQLYVSTLHPIGQGALELAFQQMRAKLEAEGLFAPERKRQLPPYPRRIVLVTSSQTAALQDMLKVLRRFPWIRVFIYHVPVQGDGCARRIAEGIDHVSRSLDAIGGADVMLLARGGGSLEDLWGFNEETVARAIARCRIPVVTGIGHEVDTSIADLVADYHAHTPTEAAQVVTAHWRGAAQSVDSTVARLRRAMHSMARQWRHRLTGCERHEMFRRPLFRVIALRQLVDDRHRVLAMVMGERVRKLQRRVEGLGVQLNRTPPVVLLSRQRERVNGIEQALRNRTLQRLRRASDAITQLNTRVDAHHPRIVINLAAARLEALSRHLEALSPEQVLKRGYSITTRKRDGRVVRDAQEVGPGERIVTRVTGGQIESIVDDSKQPRLFD